MNFQNIPRDDKVVKRAIVPKLGAISCFDYSQIEPRLTAFYAAKIGHPEFAEKISAGVDCYTAVAQLITGKAEVTADERQKWKRTYLSLLYGGGVKTIQLQFPELDKRGARKIIDTFHENWPAVSALQASTLAVVRRRGYLTSLGGRQLHMEEFGEHKLVNKLIQGGAADVMKEALIRIHAWLGTPAGERLGLTYDTPVARTERHLEAQMISVVHDDVWFDHPVGETDVLHEHIPGLMDCFPEVSEVVPITVGHEVTTTSMADKTDYDEWKELYGKSNSSHAACR